MKSYERWWEEHMESHLEKMEGWFGREGGDTFRRYPRALVRWAGYRSLLDAGAGLCAEYYGFQREYPELVYTAMDITPFFVRMGKDKGIDMVEGSLEAMPFADNAFDCVFIRNTLRHLPGYEQALQEGLRVCRKELMVVFARPLRPREPKLLYRQEEGIYDNMYDKKGISEFLRRQKDVRWFYIEPIEGRKGNPNTLLRIFKETPPHKTKLLLFHWYRAYILWNLLFPARLLTRIIRKITRILRGA